MAFAVHHGYDAILHNCIRRTERLLEINLIISAALNKAIGKIENEFPKEMKIIKSELQSEVQATLGAMHAKYEEEKKIDEEVNKAAKELEWAKDLYG
jgi:ABC-type methionine transport system ATPase subunit